MYVPTWHEKIGRSIASVFLVLPKIVMASREHWRDELGLNRPDAIEVVEYGPPRVRPQPQPAPEPEPVVTDEAPSNVVPLRDPVRELALVQLILRECGPVNNGELAELMKARLGYGSDATAHRVVNTLEANGLAKRERDGRQVIIRAVKVA